MSPVLLGSVLSGVQRIFFSHSKIQQIYIYHYQYDVTYQLVMAFLGLLR